MFFSLQMICLNEMQPQLCSLLAYKLEEITDDDIRVAENEGEGETTREGGETLDLFVLGKWYSSANFLLISI